MEINTERIEKLFASSDFSKETDLKERLEKKVFAVKQVSLNDLMEKEGMRKEEALKDRPENKRVAVKHSQKMISPPVM
ncbi:MAG: hypothetical protein IJ805_01740 [Lachnospiraceae bacterium]|nr:hypothetical protein [Lachnospiraceae bacterium]